MIIFQPNNPSHNLVTSLSGIRNMKWTLQYQFLYRVAPYLSNNILPITEYKTTVKSIHSEAVFKFISSLADNHDLHTSSPQIARKEVNFPLPYRTSLTRLRSRFCRSHHSYREGIELIPQSPLPFLWRGILHHRSYFLQPLACYTYRSFSAWLRSSFLVSLFLISCLFLPLPPELPPSSGHESLVG